MSVNRISCEAGDLVILEVLRRLDEAMEESKDSVDLAAPAFDN